MQCFVALLGVGIAAAYAPSLWMRSWRHSWGVPTKWFGLLSLEIDSSHCSERRPSSNQGWNYAIWTMMCGAFVEKSYGSGPMSWDTYHRRTCDDAMFGDSGFCLLDPVLNAVTPWDTRCARVRDRCNQLHHLRFVNYGTFALVVFTEILSVGACIGAITSQRQCTVTCTGVASFISLLILIVYGWFGSESFSGLEDTEGGHLGDVMYDPPRLSWAFLIASVGCLACFANLGFAAMTENVEDRRRRLEDELDRRRRSSESLCSPKGHGRKQQKEVELVPVIAPTPRYQQASPPHFEVPRAAPVHLVSAPHGGGSPYGGYHQQQPFAPHPPWGQQPPQAQSFPSTSYIQQWPQYR